MRTKIGVTLLISLLLSMLFMPLAVAADGGKSIIKEMVQSPAYYSVENCIFCGNPFQRFEFTPFWRWLTNNFDRLPFFPHSTP